MKSFLLVLILVYCCSFTRAVCRNVTALSDMDMRQMRGLWYVREVTRNSSVLADATGQPKTVVDKMITCPRIVYHEPKPDVFGTIMVIKLRSDLKKYLVSFIDGKKLASGTYNFQQEGKSASFIVKVTATDYDNWLVLHACAVETNNDGVFIHSRTTDQFSQDANQQINQALKDIGIERSDMDVDDIKNCAQK